MLSSWRSTSLVRLVRNSVGTVVIDDDESELLLSFFLDCVGLYRLLLICGSLSMPRACSCAEVSKLPQILTAESIPSFASDAKSVGEVHGKVEQGNALI